MISHSQIAARSCTNARSNSVVDSLGVGVFVLFMVTHRFCLTCKSISPLVHKIEIFLLSDINIV